MFKMLQKVYGNECLSRTNVFEQYGKFRNRRESVDDDTREGHSQTSRTPDHIIKLRVALADNQCSTIRIFAEWFHIDKETVRKIIKEDLGEKKVVCAICSPCADVRIVGRSRNFLSQLPSNAQKCSGILK